MNISVTGLHGGHSGDEIHKGYGNSIKIISRLLQDLEKKYNIQISNFTGGNLRNAIPREAFLTITFNPAHEELILADTATYNSLVRDEYGALEPDRRGYTADMPSMVIDPQTQHKLPNALHCSARCVTPKEIPDLLRHPAPGKSIRLIEDK
jgi:dipeptidase D